MTDIALAGDAARWRLSTGYGELARPCAIADIRQRQRFGIVIGGGVPSGTELRFWGKPARTGHRVHRPAAGGRAIAVRYYAVGQVMGQVSSGAMRRHLAV